MDHIGLAASRKCTPRGSVRVRSPPHGQIGSGVQVRASFQNKISRLVGLLGSRQFFDVKINLCGWVLCGHFEVSSDPTWSYVATSRSKCLVQIQCGMMRLHHNNPSYLRDLLTIHNPSRNLRSSSHHLLSVGYMRTVSSSRCYKHSAATNWNDLPYDIRDCGSVSVLKRKLKSHLISIAYIT